jgi:hypothetical protein
MRGNTVATRERVLASFRLRDDRNYDVVRVCQVEKVEKLESKLPCGLYPPCKNSLPSAEANPKLILGDGAAPFAFIDMSFHTS